MAEQDQKRTMILEAALKRFKRFGLSKTTMEEIARDLEISKGSLYYYFSDKESIYVAVVERMIADCFLDMSAYVEEAPSTSAIIDRYLELKEKMLLEYHFLFGVNEWVKDVPSTLMRQTIELLQQVEISFLSATITKGVNSGELNKDTDAELTAQLLVNVLFGLWVIWCKWQAACATLSSQVAALAVTCSTPSLTSPITNVRVSSAPSPEPSSSSSDGAALTLSLVAGPKLLSKCCPVGGVNATWRANLPGATSVADRWVANSRVSTSRYLTASEIAVSRCAADSMTTRFPPLTSAPDGSASPVASVETVAVAGSYRRIEPL